METKYYYNSSVPTEVKDKSIDQFIGQRGRILNSKLEILLEEIKARLAIRDKNIHHLDDDMSKVKENMSQLSPRVYYFADTPEKDAFHKLRQSGLELEKEKRDQDVSCWQDVTRVMQELINTWEAHQQTAARSQLLKSDGLEKILNDTYGAKPEEKNRD